MHACRYADGDHTRQKGEGKLVRESAFEIPPKVRVIAVMLIGREKLHIVEKAPKHQADEQRRGKAETNVSYQFVFVFCHCLLTVKHYNFLLLYLSMK